jgi:hypothetical protein
MQSIATLKGKLGAFRQLKKGCQPIFKIRLQTDADNIFCKPSFVQPPKAFHANTRSSCPPAKIELYISSEFCPVTCSSCLTIKVLKLSVCKRLEPHRRGKPKMAFNELGFVQVCGKAFRLPATLSQIRRIICQFTENV